MKKNRFIFNGVAAILRKTYFFLLFELIYLLLMSLKITSNKRYSMIYQFKKLLNIKIE